MYDSFWELHDMATVLQRHELKPENEEVQQDMFDSLCIETCIEQTHLFEHSNADELSRPLPRHPAVFLKSAGDSPKNCPYTTPHSMPKQEHPWSVPLPEHNGSMKAGVTTFHVEGGPSWEGETSPWLAAAKRPTWPACHEPIDLTRLLNRCEGDVELLKEVLDDFCVQGRSACDALRLAAAEGNDERATFHADFIAGAARNVGAAAVDAAAAAAA
eukprot:CAMPEP_0172162554 /NCGR_PEP_ID=MMETSP1050-20130122/6741_1 /TAXON_ID=233186 /ORGANISM="Cryptomonas curvata, Strain CCAP979/52" /LENGTH=214 /DNA_ID=CAMNT_0012832567 /DNA_START=219 /DNA_END=859 /DNA_ORIENTATION=-